MVIGKSWDFSQVFLIVIVINWFFFVEYIL
jgi:hypothetical protein